MIKRKDLPDVRSVARILESYLHDTPASSTKSRRVGCIAALLWMLVLTVLDLSLLLLVLYLLKLTLWPELP